MPIRAHTINHGGNNMFTLMLAEMAVGAQSMARSEFTGQSGQDTQETNMNQLTITATDTVADVFRLLRDVLQQEDLIDEYFDLCIETDQTFFSLVESYRWTACYAVTGGSEGNYIHVDLIDGYDRDYNGKAQHLITGKTFLGLAHALKIANRCAELLRV